MNIISWNVNGIRAAVKKDFFKSIKKLDPDILCLQETKAQEDEAKEATTPLEGYHLYFNSADKKGYSGTGLLSKPEPMQVVLDMGVAEHDAEDGAGDPDRVRRCVGDDGRVAQHAIGDLDPTVVVHRRVPGDRGVRRVEIWGGQTAAANSRQVVDDRDGIENE